MTKLTTPKYGRIQFLHPRQLVERMQQAAQYLGEEAVFSSYATDREGDRHYGLDYGELLAEFGEEPQTIQMLRANWGDERGRSLTLSLRGSQTGLEGQFTVVADSPFQQRELIELLEGTWQALPEAEQQKRQQLARLIQEVRRQATRREMRERKISSPAGRTTEPAISEEGRRMDKFPLLYDHFQFDEDLAPEVYTHVLDQLSEHFFQEEDFYIRAVTLDGRPFGDIGLEGAHTFLSERRKDLRRLYAEVHAPREEWMTLQLDFGPEASGLRAELEVSSRRNKQIQATLRDALEPTPELTLGRASMIHELFSFEESSFSLDQVIKLLRSLSARFLQQESITAFLSTHQGETYPGLRLKALRQLYLQHEEQVSFLLFGVNQAETGRTFSLMFQFAGPGQPAHGSLSMMWGSHGVHQAIRALIWRDLGLQKYQPLAYSEQNLPPQSLTVQPSFDSRNFQPQPLTSLVLMPLEAYWSDSLWEQVDQKLKELGYENQRADSLFSEESREGVWIALNQVDLVLADLTYKHPSVYYWVGVAHTLGKPCLLLSQHDRDLPPDLSGSPSLIYDNNLQGLERLLEFLEQQVKGKIGRG